MKVKKVLALTCAIVITASALLTSCGGNSDSSSKSDGSSSSKGDSSSKGNSSTSKSKTLVLGEISFNGVFSPFFSKTVPDGNVTKKITETLIGNDRLAEPVDHSAKYVTPEVVNGADGKPEKTIYTFELLDDVKFSDGTLATADDIIFAIKVFCDPNYDGVAVYNTLPIIGVNEYRYDDKDYASKIDGFKTESKTIAEDELLAAIKSATKSDVENYGIDTIVSSYGFTVDETLKDDALFNAVWDMYYNVEVEALASDAELKAHYTTVAEDMKFKELEKEYIKTNLSSGTESVSDIEGVKKLNDKTVEITLTGVDPSAIWQLGGLPLVPEKYYDPDFKKGDLSKVKSKNGAPMGAGAYIFSGYKDNVVTLDANPHYFKGEPNISKIKMQVVDDANKLENIKLGNTDISDPSASLEMIEQVKDANLHYELIDNLGYGYIGINAERITDKNVRKGLMSLMNRAPAIEAYYGELADIIERPMSKVSWAYPQDATAYYPYSKEKATEYFTAAGYAKDASGALSKGGKKLVVEIGVGSLADHPSGPIITQMKSDMAELGAELIIQDLDFAVLSDAVKQNTIDMFVMAWQATIDPDMYQLYNSKSNDNPYNIKNDELDKLMMEARSTLDVEVRKELYFKCLDIIMEEAVEMPVYQRKNLYVFNPANVEIESIPKDMTPFYDHFAEIQSLQMVK